MTKVFILDFSHIVFEDKGVSVTHLASASIQNEVVICRTKLHGSE